MSTKKSFLLTDEVVSAARTFGSALEVTPVLHPDDHMFGFLYGALNNPLEVALNYYFNGGAHDASVIVDRLKRLGISRSALSILEFAAGYGRITRHLVSRLEAKRYVVCDIHLEAVNFLKAEMGVISVLSSSVPEELNIQEKFDFIFVLSLFSHLPDGSFQRWLRALYERLSPGGYLLFTTHGEAAMEKASNLREGYDEAKGFGYLLRSEQLDLDFKQYGTTVATPRYVISAIYDATKGQIESFTPNCWFGIQDEWIVRKSK